MLAEVIGEVFQDEQCGNAACRLGCVNVGIDPMCWLGVVRASRRVSHGGDPQIATFV